MRAGKLNLLFIGTYNSEFVKQLCERLDKNRFNIDVFDLEGLKLIRNGEVIIEHKKSSFYIKKLNSIYDVWMGYKILKQLRLKYDYLQIFYMRYEYMLFFRKIKQLSENIIVHVYGDDFYGNSKNNLIKPMYNVAQKIAFTNPVVRDDFERHYKFSDPDKYVILNFGLEALDAIKAENSKDSNRTNNPFASEKKTVISVGTSTQTVEQHELIIGELLQLKIPKDKIKFIFQLNYGPGLNEAATELLSKLSDKYETQIVTEYMDIHALAKLRLATDILISLRRSDQLSAAITENLYAKSIVITGAWLPYKTFKDLGLVFFEIDSIQDINSKLLYVFENFEKVKSEIKTNSDIVYNNFNWNKIIEDWYAFYLK